MLRVRHIAYAILFLFPLLLLRSPADYAAACAEGIALWSKAVLPALFPFMVTASLLVGTGAFKSSDKLSPLMRSVKLPAAAALCILLSALSGYPIGSRTLLDMKNAGTISSQDGTRTAAVCSTSGPMFLLGSVGGAMFADARAGAVLLASHFCGVFLTAACFLPFLKPAATPSRPAPLLTKSTNVFAQSIQSSVIAILCVGGFIAYFCVVARALEKTGLLGLPVSLVAAALAPFGQQSAAEGAVYGLLECTRGCALLSASGASLSLPLAAFCVTFGGASILAQQIAFLKPAGANIKIFIGVKALQAVAAFFVCLLLCLLFY